MRRSPFVLLIVCLCWNATAAAQQLIFDANDRRVTLRAGEVGGASNITVMVDGMPMGVGDQLRVADAPSPGSTSWDEVFVVDTNGFFRIRHHDLDAIGTPDPFGTSGVLPPGLIVQNGGGERFLLKSQVTQMNLITTNAANGILSLQMSGAPADDQGPLAGVSVNWELTLRSTTPPHGFPIADSNEVHLRVDATFNQTIQLNAQRAINAEAFRAAVFSSSNVPADHTMIMTLTHDADEARVTAADGESMSSVNLTTTLPNMLLFGPNGQLSGHRIQLNQRTPAPLNGDPPNISFELSDPDPTASYRAQGYITVEAGTNEDADNVGVWLNRSFDSNTIPAGTQLTWNVALTASDDVLPLVAGDYDKNGSVNGSDLSLWKGVFSLPSAFASDADGDRDGDADGNDFLLWQRRLGQVFPAATTGASSDFSAPEPDCCIMLVLAMSLAVSHTRGISVGRCQRLSPSTRTSSFIVSSASF
jgi:hypothetical protein